MDRGLFCFRQTKMAPLDARRRQGADGFELAAERGIGNAQDWAEDFSPLGHGGCHVPDHDQFSHRVSGRVVCGAYGQLPFAVFASDNHADRFPIAVEFGHQLQWGCGFVAAVDHICFRHFEFLLVV